MGTVQSRCSSSWALKRQRRTCGFFFDARACSTPNSGNSSAASQRKLAMAGLLTPKRQAAY